jgi:hypothetical protein
MNIILGGSRGDQMGMMREFMGGLALESENERQRRMKGKAERVLTFGNSQGIIKGPNDGVKLTRLVQIRFQMIRVGGNSGNFKLPCSRQNPIRQHKKERGKDGRERTERTTCRSIKHKIKKYKKYEGFLLASHSAEKMTDRGDERRHNSKGKVKGTFTLPPPPSIHPRSQWWT